MVRLTFTPDHLTYVFHFKHTSRAASGKESSVFVYFMVPMHYYFNAVNYKEISRN